MKRLLFFTLLLTLSIGLSAQYETSIKVYPHGGLAAWSLEDESFNQGVTFGAGVLVESGRAEDQAAYFMVDVSYTSLYDAGRQRYLQSSGGIGITNRSGIYAGILAIYLHSPSDEIEDLAGLGVEFRGTVPLPGIFHPFFMARGMVLSNGRFTPTATVGAFYSF